MILNYLFEGIDCVACVSKLEDKIKKINGVNSININYFLSTFDIDVKDMDVMKDVIKICDKFEDGVTLISCN